MDPITQRLLQRTRARREDLARKMAENKVESQNRKAPLRPSSTINTMESKTNEAGHSQKSAPGTSPSSSPKTSMKKRFNMLATQRSQWDVQEEGKELDSSPVLPKMQTQLATSLREEPASQQPVPHSRKSRFAALAANINAWEDDTCHSKQEIKQEEIPVKKWQRPAPTESQEESRPTPAKREVTQTRVTNQIQPRSPIKKSMQKSDTVVNQNDSHSNQTRPTMSRAARFQLGSSRLGDGGFQTCTARNVVLPQSSKCSVVDKPTSKIEPRAAPRTIAASPRKVEEKGPSPKKRPSQEQDTAISSKKQATASDFAQTKKSQPPMEDTPNLVSSPNRVEPKVGAMAKSIHDRLKAHQNNWQSNEISKKAQEDRMKDLAVLKKRYIKSGGEVRKDEPGEEKLEEEEEEEEEEEIAEFEEDDTMEEEEGEVYMETDIDDVTDSCNVPEVSPPVTDEDETPEDRDSEEEEADDDADDEDESEVNLTDVLGDMDQLIEDAERAMKEEQEKAKPPVVEPQQQQVETACERPKQSEQPPAAVERRPAPQAVNPQPRQRIVREEQVRVEATRNRGISRNKQSINAEKITVLQEEVSRQQIIITQTSQALSLIACNESLRNTVEEIEAEKMMVISNQKRQACLSEIQFLKNAPISEPVFTDNGDEVVPPKGHVLIKDIRLPFKTAYIMDFQSNKEMPSHYYFIISRCGAQTTTTNLMDTRQNLKGDCLKFSTEVTINDLDSDFSIELLVYQLRCTVTRVEGMAERAQIQHAAPTKHSRFGSLTPKKFLSNKNSSKKNGKNMTYLKSRTHSSKSSTQGQGSSKPVRGSTFALVGSGRLSLASCGTTKFMLSRVPLTSPLEGSIHLCMSCQKNSSIVLKGFLTMFDEISGFGSWHRRWCILAEGYVTYWKYPDDEKKKPPIGSIDLRECITREVAQIPRILCARPNTFELVTSRPASRYEKDTLISSCNNSMLTTKHMISADVKEERVEWIDSLNRTLEDLRMWNKDAAAPRE